MKKTTKKLAIALLALSCASVCVGVGVSAAQPVANSVTASAETTYTEYTVADLTVHIHSTAGNANCNNTSLWLYGTADTSDAWAFYTYESGAGVKLNGESADINVQDFHSGIYLSFAAVSEGDVISIGGTFVNADRATKYIITECSFKWNGSGWEKYSDSSSVTYTDYTIADLRVADTSMAGGAYVSNSVLSVTMTGGAAVTDWPWLVYESGEGFKVNGESASLTGGIPNAIQDTNGGLYFQFDGVNAGDVVSLGGVFTNAALGIRYTIPETQFTWTGTEWESKIDYTTYELGVIEPNTNSSYFGAGSATSNGIYTAGLGTLPVQDWSTAFALDSGYGVKVNGEEVSYEVKSTDGGLYFGLTGIKVNDVVSVCGTFKNAKHATKYVIEESKMLWNGYTWEKYTEYTEYELGEMRVAASSNATAVYLTRANGEGLPMNSWDYRFQFLVDSGVGITLNDEQIVTNDIKSPDGAVYISFSGHMAEEGAVLKVGGTFRNVDTATAYVISESEFVYVDSAWKNKIDIVKEAACETLESYKGNFSQEDYYEAEWASFDTIIEEGKANINAATTNEAVEAALAAAKTKMDNVVTKEESDAIFSELKGTAKAELAAYKTEADYRAAGWVEIQEILAQANAAIDAGESVTAVQTAVEDAKEAMDAVKTAAQWDADEAVVAAAKAELAAYKDQSVYHEAEWAAIQAIITEANADLDNAIGNEAAISEIVAEAKADIDAVKTAEQVDAEKAVVDAAKAELAAYKSESNYKTAEWTAIQAIITEANGDIDAAIGDEAAIEDIVAAAKLELDLVKTAKDVSKDEVKAYYAALDHDAYSEEAATTISSYVASVLSEIENATTIEEMDAAIAQFKADVETVEKEQPNSGSGKEDGSSDSGATGTEGAGCGCGSVIVDGASVGLVGLAIAVGAFLRKKKED